MPDPVVHVPDKVDLVVNDPDGPVRVSLAHEGGHVRVDLRAPSEVIPELRELRPQVDSELSRGGYDLDDFQATPGDDRSGSAQDPRHREARARDGGKGPGGDEKHGVTPATTASRGIVDRYV